MRSFGVAVSINGWREIPEVDSVRIFSYFERIEI
jgi:hypothetical protein